LACEYLKYIEKENAEQKLICDTWNKDSTMITIETQHCHTEIWFKLAKTWGQSKHKQHDQNSWIFKQICPTRYHIMDISKLVTYLID